MAIRYSNVPMGYSIDRGRFSNNPTGGGYGTPGGPRFPANARSMESAPTGSRPIRVFEPDGRSQWALYHGSAWRPLESYKDAGGVTRWKMTGGFVNNPICWASS
jgi:hypothetical protein